MNLTIRLLGCEVLAICTDDAANDQGPGDSTTYPVGFTPGTPYRVIDSMDSMSDSCRPGSPPARATPRSAGPHVRPALGASMTARDAQTWGATASARRAEAAVRVADQYLRCGRCKCAWHGLPHELNHCKCQGSYDERESA